MSKVIWSLLLCVLFAATAPAQAGPHRSPGDWEPPSVEDRVEHLSQDLDLDEKQTAELLEIFTTADQERQALREQHEEQIHQDICMLHNRVTGQIKSVLTAEQSIEFDELMARRGAHRESHHSRHENDRRSPIDCEETGA